MTIEEFIKIMKRWEGGLSKDLSDSASAHFCPTPYKDGHRYHTNKGITYAVWKSYFGSHDDLDFYVMSDVDWFKIFDNLYFKGVRGHKFDCLNIGLLVADFAWGSGINPAGKQLQRACNSLGSLLVVDGQIGSKTITEANKHDKNALFDSLVNVRRQFYHNIAIGKNSKFLRGWLNRLNDDALKLRP
jgi:lysozyme family protein